MKLQWLGDIKDAFKFGVCLSVIECLKLKKLLWVMMLTENGNEEPYEALHCVPKDLRSYLYELRYKRVIKKEELKEPVSKLENILSININAIEDDFTDRKTYFKNVKDEVKNLENSLILLDPDTGFEPNSKVGRQHVKYEEVKDIFAHMKNSSVLAVFQHWRQGQTDEQIIAEIAGRLKENNLDKCTVCLYTSKAQVLMFLFLKNKAFIERVIQCIRATGCFEEKKGFGIKSFELVAQSG